MNDRGAIILVLLLCFAYTKAQDKNNRPNIIYIMTDDLGYADLSCYGRKDYTTPNLDKLAIQGMRFTHAYSGGPMCTPTRVSFMTGRYPARLSLGLIEPIDWTAKDSAIGLTPTIPSLATLLKKVGYHTALIGKWHLGFKPEFSPIKNGFDEFFGFHGGGIDYVSHSGPKKKPDLYENDKAVLVEGYSTDIFTDKAIEFVKRKHDKPFFLSLQHNAPHWPWQGATDGAYHDTMDFKAGGTPQIFAAIMKSLDDNIGRLMNSLDETGLAKNTVVIFVSDNGGERFSDMGPLTGRKMLLWEGGIRVPALVRWPGKIKAGAVTTQPVITMDWTATILSLAGAKQDKNLPMDGQNLLPFLTGKKNEFDRTFYWRVHQRNQQKAIREGKWKYLKDEKGEYLFNLAIDQSEKNDLKSIEPDLFQDLKNKYAAWEATVLLPVPLRR
ncbi:MAG: sulfatase [Bacteroidota bacterium]